MTSPGDDSRTELAWREIVENYGERVLPDDLDQAGEDDRPAAERPQAPHPEGATVLEHDDVEPDQGTVPDDVPDAVPDPVDAVAEVDRFRPPEPPPLPRPRTWQRGVAWSGVFVAPVIALVIALFSIYVTPLLGWALVAWFVGGFGYLVSEMPRSPRDPWDDGSRV